MGSETPRLNLIEDYDRNYGFITDAIVDVTPSRKTLMARPSLNASVGFGPITTSTFDIAEMTAVYAFGVNFPGASLYPNTLVHYAAATFAGVNNMTLDPNTLFAIYDLDHDVGVGEQAQLLTNETEPFPGRICSAVGIYYGIHNPVVVAGGAGYSVNDTILLDGGTTANGVMANLLVTGVTAGAVTSVSIIEAGKYLTLPTQPAASTSAPGAGATFNFTAAQMQGVIANQARINLMAEMYVGLINTQTGLADFQNGIGASGFNGTFVGSVVCLSDYNFMLSTDGFIYNCDAGNVFSWRSTSFTQAFSDASTQPLTLAVHNGYLVAVGNNEVRFFYVTGDSTGSSVAPVLNTKHGIGALSASTVVFTDEILIFVGYPDNTGVPVYMYSPNSQVPERVSYPYLENVLSTYGVKSGVMVTFRGHTAYCVNTNNDGGSYVFDLHTRLWYKWNPFETDTGYALDFVSVYANVSYGLNVDLMTEEVYQITVQQAHNDVSFGGALVPYTPYVVCKPLDFTTMYTKQYESATLIGDYANVTIQVSYSDDGGTTFSTARSVSMNQQNPVTRNLGQGRRRMWKVQLPMDWAARQDAIEFRVRAGVM